MKFFSKITQTKSLKVNAIFNALYQILNMVVPLLTAPFIARVLGPENNGIYSYYYSIVTYFVLFATFGFNEFGTKFISVARDNKEERSRRFFAINAAKILIGIITLVVYFVMILSLYIKDINSLILYLFLSLFIESIADSTYLSNRGILFFMLLALVLSEKIGDENSCLL